MARQALHGLINVVSLLELHDYAKLPITATAFHDILRRAETWIELIFLLNLLSLFTKISYNVEGSILGSTSEQYPLHNLDSTELPPNVHSTR